jgi:para-aminobenzoate synthetase component 1
LTLRTYIELPDLDNSHLHLFAQGIGEDPVVLLNGNDPESKSILGFGVLDELKIWDEQGAFDRIKAFSASHPDWLFGYFSYDLKNDVELLTSQNADGLAMPYAHFFRPRFVLKWDEQQLLLGFDSDSDTEEAARSWMMKKTAQVETLDKSEPIHLSSRESKASYLNKIETVQKHIQLGDIYELNFCQEFYAENVELDPAATYKALNSKTLAPFSCFYQHDEFSLLCASPERFLKKEGQHLTSQPIKGTIKRGASALEDEQLKQQLLNDPKERGENVMIVDLVRNDLSKTAVKGSVNVDELFGIYSFETVHQMISTVSSTLRDDFDLIDAVKAAFPMGSMTGAPKVRAMQLIEDYELTKRGLYSGAVGYISPEGDADFNVVIRSLIYNANTQYLSLMVGGAITAKSIPEREYEECLLKAAASMEVLRGEPATIS